MKNMSEIKDPELVASIEKWVNAERERAVKPLTTKIADLERRLAVMHAEVSELKGALPMRDTIIQQLVESTNKVNKENKGLRAQLDKHHVDWVDGYRVTITCKVCGAAPPAPMPPTLVPPTPEAVKRINHRRGLAGKEPFSVAEVSAIHDAAAPAPLPIIKGADDICAGCGHERYEHTKGFYAGCKRELEPLEAGFHRYCECKEFKEHTEKPAAPHPCKHEHYRYATNYYGFALVKLCEDCGVLIQEGEARCPR